MVAGEERRHTEVLIGAPAVGARTVRDPMRALTKGKRVWIVEHGKAMVNEGLAAAVGEWISGVGVSSEAWGETRTAHEQQS